MKLAAVQMNVVPFGTGPDGSIWVPSEPGMWPVGPPSTVMTLRDLSAGVESMRQLRSKSERRLTEILHLRLQQLLDFLDDRGVDICVFPEYAFPCDSETLSLLHGFSERMTVVAGIGQPRTRGVEALAEFTDDQVHPLNNVAAVFHRRQCYLVTKTTSAEYENIQSGSGPRLLALPYGMGTINLGVAICKDYLVGGASQVWLDDVPDVLAIPSLSSRSSPFNPGEPRDFPRIFANAAAEGGSSIFAAGCMGVFTEKDLPLPLPPGAEGVLSVDWHGAPEKPTKLLGQANTVHLRSAIVTQSDGSAAKEVVASLKLFAESQDFQPQNLETIPRWIRFLDERPALRLLRDSVVKYREALDDEVLDQSLAETLSRHVLSVDAPSLDDARRQTLEEIAAQIDRLITRGVRDSDKYRLLLQAADSYAEWRPGARKPPNESAPDDLVLHLQIGMGVFDRDEAVATIPDQEDFLRSFLAGAPDRSRISFILRTNEEPVTGAVSAQFQLRFYGPNTAEAQRYFKELEPIVRSVFVRGWSLYTPRSEDIEGVCIEIMPAEGNASAGGLREDLGLLVDAMRASGGSKVLEMVASPSGVHPENAIDSIDVGIRFFSARPDVAIVNLIGSTIFPGGWTASDVEQSSSPSMVTMPLTSGLNILHPPDGHIEGRGMAKRRRLEIAATDDVEFPSEGAPLGKAIVQHPAVDRVVDARIANSSRTVHTYVIGRTGSGKTNTLKNIVRHDLSLKSAVVVIDPHGDLFDYALRHVVGHREFVSLDFSSNSIPSINPIYLDATDEAGVLRNIDDLVEAMVASTYHEFAGPRFRDIARLCLETLVAVADESSGRFASLTDVTTLIEDRRYRDGEVGKLVGLGRGDLKRRWDAHHRMKLEEQAEVEQWFVSKFSDFRRSTRFQAAVSGRPDISLEACLKNHSALLIRVPTIGLGVGPSRFLGSLIVERVLRYTMERGFNELSDPASLVVDEFQTFVGTSFAQLIPEARKFNLAITVANQTLSQLSNFSAYEGSRSDQMTHAILGNVGNLIVQSVGYADASRLGQELGMSVDDVMRIGKYSAAAVLTVRGLRSRPFTINLYDAGDRPGRVSEATLKSEIEASVQRAAQSVAVPLIPRMDGPEETSSEVDGSGSSRSSGSFLDDWLERRRNSQALSQDGDAADSQDGGAADSGVSSDGSHGTADAGAVGTRMPAIDEWRDARHHSHALQEGGAADVDGPSDGTHIEGPAPDRAR